MKSNKYLLICLPCPSCTHFILSDFPALKCTMFSNHTFFKVGKQKKKKELHSWIQLSQKNECA